MDIILNEAKTACEKNINIENENDRIIFDKKLAKDHGKWASIYKTLISYRADILNPAAWQNFFIPKNIDRSVLYTIRAKP